jgi:pilus assembly protein CpaC
MRTEGMVMAASTIRAAALAGLIAPWLLAHAAAGEVDAGTAPPQVIHVAASDNTSHSVTLGVGKSLVVDLPRDIKDVLVADPKVANAVVRSSRRAYIIAISDGATNIFFFDAQGRQIAGFNISVARDIAAIRKAIRELIPDSDVEVEAIGDGIILTGTVATQLEAQQAYDIASHFVASGDTLAGGGNSSSTYSSNSSGGTYSSNSTSTSNSGSGSGSGSSAKVVNAITVRGRDEVMLKVTVAEMDRTVLKQLGVNLSGSLGYGTSLINFNTSNPFPINGAPSNSLSGTFQGVTATVQAMEQAGVVHTLAEPNLTAISGEDAHFLAGGMFPYPNISCTGGVCTPAIQFQNFGVSLTFTPVVLSEGRISLHMMTEVSELNNQDSVTIGGVTVPGLTVRRADTTVEIPSGGTLAMAGMIQDQTKQDVTGLPGLMQVPILGPLFKSRDFLNNRTELVVLVTPYIVHAVAQKDLSRPDDGFADPSDPATVFLGNLNRIYGVGGRTDAPADTYYGKYGFILD